MINRQRLSEEFLRQAAIASPSYHEGEMADYLEKRFQALGGSIEFDDAGTRIGSTGNNLIVRLPGSKIGAPLLLSVHMDTVTPAENIEPVLRDGIFRSAGNTILGADDKAGIVEIIEALEILREQKIPHVPLEVVVTICEEQGLLGAKQLNFQRLQARRGIALDTTGVDIVINRAPAANRFKATIFGLEAHAGVCPEQGISAIEIAGRAIARMPLGRIDEETTANIGTIEGGLASNIVPRRVSLCGEVRSHNLDKLRLQTELIVKALEEEVDRARIVVNGEPRNAAMTLELQEDFPNMQVPLDAPILRLIRDAGDALQRPQEIRAAGGGSDANIFNGQGIEMVILATGMSKVHTVNEQVSVEDLARVSELLVEIIRRA
jgi:tripeptide aminopeptidase